MEHEQDKQSDCESDDEDTVHVLSVRDSDDGYWVTPRLENKAGCSSVRSRGCDSGTQQAEKDFPCTLGLQQLID